MFVSFFRWCISASIFECISIAENLLHGKLSDDALVDVLANVVRHRRRFQVTAKVYVTGIRCRTATENVKQSGLSYYLSISSS